MAVSFERIQADFPVLSREVYGRPLVYLDNSATSQTPVPVRAAIDAYYAQSCANVHRGLHALSAEATEAYEGARDKVAKLIGAPGRESVVFTRGTTAAINLVASSWAQCLQPGDAILTTVAEHHANLIPWQQAAKRRGAELRHIPLTAEGVLDLSKLDELLTPNVKLVAFAQVSNVLGYVAPAAELIAAAKSVGAVTLVDAAQSVGHMPVDFGALGCDFRAFSGHKMCGPTGIGCLIGRPDLLAAMEPIEYGGDMIVHVDLHEATWNHPPYKFEAGTPPIAQAIGLGAACDYVSELGLDWIRDHTVALCDQAAAALSAIDGVHVHGPLTGRLGPVAFSIDGVHPHDVATLLDGEGVAVRAGHHCAQPLHSLLGAPSTARASFYVTNQASDIDRLVAGIAVVKKVFG